MPNVLVIEAHPDPDSFGAALAHAYADGARQGGAQVQTLPLWNLTFDPILRSFTAQQSLEPDLLRARAMLEEADHLVFQFPVWWGTMPALLKGFVDRVFLPGWAFRYVPGRMAPQGLLGGRSARVLTTMDSPWWWYWLKHRWAAHRSLVQATLHYVGITAVQSTTIYALRTLSAEQRADWLRRVHQVGRRDVGA